MPKYAALALAIPFLVFFAAIFVFVLPLFPPWLRATTTGVRIHLPYLLGMRLRGTPPGLIVDAYVQLAARGREVEIGEVERQYIAYKQRVRNAGDLVDLVEKNLVPAS